MYHFYYIAETQFENADAANNRIINNINAIIGKNDCIVTIIGYGDKQEFIYDGIKVRNVKKGKGSIQKLFYFVLRGFFIYRLLCKELVQPDLIIYYGNNFRFFYPIMKYVRRKKIKIVCDIVEWYNPSHLPVGGKFSPLALDASLGLKYFVPKCNGIISISSYLEKYFISKKVKTIRIPVLVDTRKEGEQSFGIESFDEKYLNLIYAGFPGKKDLIWNVINAIESLHSDKMKIRLHILGPTADEIGIKTKLQPSIICYGRINQKMVSEYLKQADFSIFVRPKERYAEAGFPTKFVESLNSGLPVIANLTSDLSYYLRDGYNGFIVKDCSVDSIKMVLKNVALLNRNTIETMKYNAKMTASENFDFRLFTENFSKFFCEVLNAVN